jgi:tripartite-type tricarboxylate transporter receptor subunit TctC
VSLLVLIAATAGAATATFPVKPIRLISPFAPGGGNDTISRALAQVMSKNIGQPIVVENRPGANTIIGMEIVAKAPPDGYTVIMTSSSLAINAALYPKLPYDSESASRSREADRAYATTSLRPGTPAASQGRAGRAG